VSWAAFLWRNLSRNRLRSFLTGAAIALAVALVCFLATMPDGLDRMLDSVAANTRIVVHDSAGVAYDWMPYAYVAKIRAMPGVVGVASWTWFGGAYRNEGISFPNMAVEPDAVGARSTTPSATARRRRLSKPRRASSVASSRRSKDSRCSSRS
jgi:hypothetical protein